MLAYDRITNPRWWAQAAPPPKVFRKGGDDLATHPNVKASPEAMAFWFPKGEQ